MEQETEILALDNERAELLKRFDISPDIDLSKEEKTLMYVLAAGEADFIELCLALDWRPSKLDSHLSDLEALDLVTSVEDEDAEIIFYSLTPTGESLLGKNKKMRKAEKKFRKFVESLSTEELEEFFGLYSVLEQNSADAAEDDAAEEIPADEAPAEEAPAEEAPAEEVPADEAPAEEAQD